MRARGHLTLLPCSASCGGSERCGGAVMRARMSVPTTYSASCGGAHSRSGGGMKARGLVSPADALPAQLLR